MNKETTNSTEFLAIYNDLDRYMRRTLNEDEWTGHTDLIKKMASKNKIFLRCKEDLIDFAKLRNAIVHNPDRKYAEPIAEPHDYALNKYKEISDKVKNPPLAINTIAIKSEHIYTTDMNAVALDVMKEMNRNTYTHVPVVENGSIIGVFSENTVFSYMVKKEDVLIEKDVKIREFADFIPIEKHVSEFFKFVSKNTLVIDIEEMFQKELHNGKRLSVVFITESGNYTEKILGLITAWDIAGYKE
ncbi:MAG: CBS domain-containing protein [Clostridiaceae bacterium]|nr:CBS domain-containing protein [Clostridiaceae bacterium]